MLFRPQFCSNCGEKIERTEWRLWTSRRFCDLCATDHRLTEFAPIVLAVFGIVAIIAGLVDFSPGDAVKAPEARAKSQVSSLATTPHPERQETSSTTAKSIPAQTVASTPIPGTGKEKSVATAVYFCGAETKKGTPCSRRVKGRVRCFQHEGMPAMATADKSKSE
ncbi:MAG: hypothetical protein H0X08_04165 [Blastocatellia bacterium]|jgi:hypothetical protein|nr:hypothetical protein [Blastocatellia bacterium]